MTPNRYAVPLEQLDAQHVQVTDLVTAQAEPAHPDAASWSGPQLHPFGDGMSGDADGE